MNEILELKGSFEQKKGKPGGIKNIPTKKSVSLSHIKSLLDSLKNVREYWKNTTLSINPLLSVYYKEIVAKSNRMSGIITNNKNNRIVGAKFIDEKINDKSYKKKHIITHCISSELLNSAIVTLEDVLNILSSKYSEKISHDDIKELYSNKNNNLSNKIKNSRIISIIVDAYYIEKFGVEESNISYNENAIINIYDTGTKTEKIMKSLDIDFVNTRTINETTLLLTPDQIRLLQLKAPYLISMAVSDLSKIAPYQSDSIEKTIIKIPSPKSEPIIGVIDTVFDETVYFSEWVDYKKMISDDIPISQNDYNHGTAVSSIIVDGANINPKLDDGCGRFRVRHFGVATAGRFSSFTILKQIQEIVAKNKDIKVWNLSLGSSLEIDPNFISPEAAILDQIQYENDVVFVIAGTNKTNHSKERKKIGAPADSINSIVVNSVDKNGEAASYSREGLVLSFYNKPDIAYYGGPMRVCQSNGEAFVSGTSFSAPWISRKMAYMINILGIGREVAKALLIDSSIDWKRKFESPEKIGYGIVPTKIDGIIHSKNDEIKFIVSGETQAYETYNYRIPVPRDNDVQPYIAKATMCYFPECSRNQGVDYTNTELDLHFGRINKGGNIDTINENKQSEEGKFLLYEENVRKNFRKWDNVKHIIQYDKTKSGRSRRAKTIIDDGLWGINIKTKERISPTNKKSTKFGLVVTLKELNGKNRLDDFIQRCYLKGWLVNRINVENRVDIYNKAEEEITFD